VKLYTCGTWSYEAMPENGGSISVYTMPEHVLDAERCATECGVAELEVAEARVVVPGRRARLSIEGFARSQAEFLDLERWSTALAAEVEALLGGHDLRTREAALQRALARVRRELREGRRAERIAREGSK